MSTDLLKIEKLNELPQNLTENTLYFVKDEDSDVIETYLTNSDGTESFQIAGKNSLVVEDWDPFKEDIVNIDPECEQGYELVDGEFRKSTNIPPIDYVEVTGLESMYDTRVDTSNVNGIFSFQYDPRIELAEGKYSIGKAVILRDIKSVTFSMEDLITSGIVQDSGSISYQLYLFQDDVINVQNPDIDYVQGVIGDGRTTILANFNNAFRQSGIASVISQITINGDVVFNGDNGGNNDPYLDLNITEDGRLVALQGDIDVNISNYGVINDKPWHCLIFCQFIPNNIYYENEADKDIPIIHNFSATSVGLPLAVFPDASYADIEINVNQGAVVSFADKPDLLEAQSGNGLNTTYNPFLIMLDSTNMLACYDLANQNFWLIDSDYIDTDTSKIKIKLENNKVSFWNYNLLEYEEQHDLGGICNLILSSNFFSGVTTLESSIFLDYDILSNRIVNGDLPNDAKDGDVYKITRDGKYADKELKELDYVQLYANTTDLIVTRIVEPGNSGPPGLAELPFEWDINNDMLSGGDNPISASKIKSYLDYNVPVQLAGPTLQTNYSYDPPRIDVKISSEPNNSLYQYWDGLYTPALNLSSYVTYNYLNSQSYVTQNWVNNNFVSTTNSYITTTQASDTYVPLSEKLTTINKTTPSTNLPNETAIVNHTNELKVALQNEIVALQNEIVAALEEIV